MNLIIAILLTSLILIFGIFPIIMSSQISKDEDMQQFQKDASGER